MTPCSDRNALFAGLGDGDHHQEHGEDGEFAHLEDAVRQPGGAGLRHLGDGGFVGGGERHAVPLPFAAPPVRCAGAGVVFVWGRWPHVRRSRGPPGGCGHHGFLGGVGAGDLGGEPTVHHQHAVGHAEDLGQIGGDHQDGHAVGGEL